MKRYAKFGYAAPFRFRVILEKPQGGQNDPPPTRAKVNIAQIPINIGSWPTKGVFRVSSGWFPAKMHTLGFSSGVVQPGVNTPRAPLGGADSAPSRIFTIT